MNFEFSDDQKMIQQQARDFLSEQSSPTVVRQVLDSDTPFHAGLWRQIGELGWLGTAIPENYGGLGLGYLELCVIAEELGRSLAPVPFASTAYLAAEALVMAGNDTQKSAWLPAMAAGEKIGCLALAEQAGRPVASNMKARVENGRLTGTKVAVLDGDVADVAVVVAKPAGSDQAALFLVDLHGSGVSRQPVATLDPTRSHGNIVFDGAPAELLGTAEQGEALLSRLLDKAAVLFAFEQVGGAQASLDMAKEYTMQRYAFGRQVASFQAIKHKMADMFVALELARSNAYYGAWALSTDAPELPLAAATARVSASEAFWLCAKENIQAHGGMGFTWEFDCHMYYRRAELLSLVLGGQPYWKDQLVTRLLAQPAA